MKPATWQDVKGVSVLVGNYEESVKVRYFSPSGSLAMHPAMITRAWSGMLQNQARPGCVAIQRRRGIHADKWPALYVFVLKCRRVCNLPAL